MYDTCSRIAARAGKSKWPDITMTWEVRFSPSGSVTCIPEMKILISYNPGQNDWDTGLVNDLNMKDPCNFTPSPLG